MSQLKDSEIIIVCDNCLQASCWHGDFMCSKAVEAGSTEKTVAELKKIGLEHPSYWEVQVKKREGGRWSA